MTRIRIHFADGAYSHERATDPTERCRCGEYHAHEVEVPEEVVALWDALSKAADEMQRQLRDLDRAWYVRQEEIKARCIRHGHAREMDGTCHYCGAKVPE